MRFGNKDGSKAFARDARRALIVKHARARATRVARAHVNRKMVARDARRAQTVKWLRVGQSGRGRVPGAQKEEPVWTIRKEETKPQTTAVEFRQDEVVGSLGQNEGGLLCVLHSQERYQHQGGG